VGMLIGSRDLECQLSSLRETGGDPSQGLFGPSSLLWRVTRESAVALGAGRALLLQLSHPLIATAVGEHSKVLNNPLKRLHQTFNIMFKMVFGTVEQSFDAARALHLRHSAVQGSLSETQGRFDRGAPYHANDAALLQWVHCTLVDSAYLMFASAFTPLNEEEREHYYRDSCRMAGLFGLASNCLPPTWVAFREYFEAECRSGSLTGSGLAKDLSDRVLRGVPSWYRALTAEFLPLSLREAFELPFGEAEQIKAARAWKWVRRIGPLLPHHLRYVGPYQEAEARIAGKTPGPVTNIMNCLWTGRSTL
jgi:uncharacterized protein (DUF2236 family)